jgi:hypothetical protein
MPHLKILSELKTEDDLSMLGEWPFKIGSLMINFASIELISYKYLNLMERTREEYDKNIPLLLGLRIDRIAELVPSSEHMDDSIKNQILLLWAEVKELSVWRNRIAHNPVMPIWKAGSNPETDPPKYRTRWRNRACMHARVHHRMQ